MILIYYGVTLQDYPGLPSKMSFDYFAYLNIFKQLIVAYYNIIILIINRSFEIRFLCIEMINEI